MLSSIVLTLLSSLPFTTHCCCYFCPQRTRGQGGGGGEEGTEPPCPTPAELFRKPGWARSAMTAAAEGRFPSPLPATDLSGTCLLLPLSLPKSGSSWSIDRVGKSSFGVSPLPLFSPCPGAARDSRNGCQGRGEKKGDVPLSMERKGGEYSYLFWGLKKNVSISCSHSMVD